ncbi:MAG TPA: hypothetical protein DCL77_09585, partial [Prolixibacteraceae bacterium]|nr:hypothetical protein [Prolixibacteraceae bacterium]
KINDRISGAIKNGAIKNQNKGVLIKLVKLSQLIYKTPLLNAEELASKIKVSVSTINRYLKILKIIGVSELKGARKTGGYLITNSFQSEIKKINEK